MEVLFLTIFLSLVLAGVFVACFIRVASRREGRGLEQQSLMPLSDDEYNHHADQP